MAQSCVLMNFRKRLKNRGYKDVSICLADKNGGDAYKVSAVEPFEGRAGLHDG
jgi:hypothetical protein